MHNFPEALLLPNRLALPAEIAYLRDKYPMPQWRAHANYGELAAFWLQIHDALREQGRVLQQATLDFREGRSDATRFQRYFMPRLGQYLQHLEGHHHIEDAHYFPRFRGLDPRMVYGFDLLENDHEIIHDALLGTADSARTFRQDLARGHNAARHSADTYADTADRLLALLEQHLGDEEELVIPGVLEHSERPLR
ncbi:MAG: hemerythrin domain-containing protein [Salinisphaera sp.]|jgi:hemerythrin-like domain-containing protein|nr:hemerythrin domain-containing protein [Salinisphaera sp.]